jgi:heptosyltransferase I
MTISASLDRICIVMMSAVGDTVHVLPVVTALKRYRPQSHITWVLQPGPASLVRGHRAVDDIIVFERSRGWRAYLDVRKHLATRSFDVVLDLQVYFKGGVVTWMTRAPVKLGFDRARARDGNLLVTTHQIPPHPTQHVQDQYFEFLTALGVPFEPVEWGIGPWPHELAAQQQFVATIDRPIAALGIGTNDPEREWPADRWAAVSDALYEDDGLQPVLVGGNAPGERATEAEILRLARHPPRSTMGVPLRDLVGILDAAALVVTVNSAPMHIAVAVGTPTVTLLGHFNPKRTGPYRKFHDLAIDCYGDPGEDYPITTVHRPGRMTRISVDDVRAKLDVWRERYRDT